MPFFVCAAVAVRERGGPLHSLPPEDLLPARAPPEPPDQHQLVTDRLLAKIEKEETSFDVQIGDGMDIGIIGENGKGFIHKS